MRKNHPHRVFMCIEFYNLLTILYEIVELFVI